MELETLFTALDQLLQRNQLFWRFQAFHQTKPLWEEHGDFWQTLLAQPPQQLTNDHQHRARFLKPWINDSQATLHLCQLNSLSGTANALPATLSYAIPGRKWQQIVPFAELIDSGQHIVEWCAGHGHLGRVLAANGAASIVSLEWNATLCQRGQQLAQRAGLAIHFDHVDVMNHAVSRHFNCDSHAVALHACGDLHMRLLQQGVQHNVRALTVAPCCYHLTRHNTYRPLSTVAQQSTLPLTKADLRLAVKTTATAGAAAKRKACKEVVWRLGFDSWQREQRNIDAYLPLPNPPPPLLRGRFHPFMQWAATLKGLAIPTEAQSTHYQRVGQTRYHTVRRVEWVQQLFARPLELWLLLDRALFLRQHGYHVTIGEFCDVTITPRNLMICAHA